MKRLGDFLLVRHRHNWLLLFRFGAVGGSGVLVNMVVAVICNKIYPAHDNPLLPIPMTEFNIRWYHLFFGISFLVANLWNFQLNRKWTFKSSAHAGWWTEYGPFLAVGLITMAIGQVIITGLMNPTSPIALSRELLDGSSGFRTPYYWAQLIAVIVTVPVSFVVNKIWTFRAVRGIEDSFERAETADQVEARLEAAAREATAGPAPAVVAPTAGVSRPPEDEKVQR